MKTERELITQMLEALDSGATLDDGAIDTDYLDAITAAREYLAAPEQSEPVAKYLGETPYGSHVQLYEDMPKGTELHIRSAPKAEPVNQRLFESLRELVAYCDETGNNWMCTVEARAAIAAAEQVRGVQDLAREAGLYTHKEVQPELQRFAALVIEQERERLLEGSGEPAIPHSRLVTAGGVFGDLYTADQLAAAVLREREACAKLCERGEWAIDGGGNHYYRPADARWCAAAIRRHQ